MGFCSSRVFNVLGDTNYVYLEEMFRLGVNGALWSLPIILGWGNGASCVPSDMFRYQELDICNANIRISSIAATAPLLKKGGYIHIPPSTPNPHHTFLSFLPPFT